MSYPLMFSPRLRRATGGLGGGGGTDPYTWNTGLDKNILAFHSGSGAWGPQSALKEAVGPSINADVTASNATELNNHIYTPGRRITLTGDISGGVFNDNHISDIDIIVPPGRLLRNCFFGAGDGSMNTNRLRVRGSTIGAFSGGQIHQLAFYGSSSSSDLIIQGMSASGPAGNNGAVQVQYQFNRMALDRMRGQCGGWFYIGTASNPTFTECSIITGVTTTSQAEAWGIRCAYETLGNIVIWGCDIRSDPVRTSQAYHRFRCHPDPGLDYVHVSHNTLIDRVESRISWIDAAAGGGSGDARAYWFRNNLIIATSVGAQPPAIEGGDVDYAYALDNTFQSDTFLSNANITMAGNTLTTETGNTFAALPGSNPAWGAAGDPTGISWNI